MVSPVFSVMESFSFCSSSFAFCSSSWAFLSASASSAFFFAASSWAFFSSVCRDVFSSVSLSFSAFRTVTFAFASSSCSFKLLICFWSSAFSASLPFFRSARSFSAFLSWSSRSDAFFCAVFSSVSFAANSASFSFICCVRSFFVSAAADFRFLTASARALICVWTASALGSVSAYTFSALAIVSESAL